MGLNRYRNKPCQCGSGIKFKYCCLQDHYKQQAGLVTSLAKKVQKKTAKYFQKRYKKITKPENNYTIGCDMAVGKSKTAIRKVIVPHPCNYVNLKKAEPLVGDAGGIQNV